MLSLGFKLGEGATLTLGDASHRLSVAYIDHNAIVIQFDEQDLLLKRCFANDRDRIGEFTRPLPGLPLSFVVYTILDSRGAHIAFDIPPEVRVTRDTATVKVRRMTSLRRSA